MSAVSAAYDKVPLAEDDENEEGDNYSYDENHDGDNPGNDIELTEFSSRSEAKPIDHFRDEDEHGRPDDDGPATRLPSLQLLEENLLWNNWNMWQEPCLLSLLLTTTIVIPTLIIWMYGAIAFVGGRLWSVWIFVIHLQLRMGVSFWQVKSLSTVGFKHRKRLRIISSLMTIFELILFGFYTMIGNVLIETFFTDHAVGSTALGWEKEIRYIEVLFFLSLVVFLSRCAIGLPSIYVRIRKSRDPSCREWRPTHWVPLYTGEELCFDDLTRQRLHYILRVFNWLVLCLNLLCFLSALSHFGPWPVYALPEKCNPLDETECSLPFPSFHHMRVDKTSATGWRVDLKGLPPLRGGIRFHPRFVNEMDGFSTMAPLLFYLDGMKEAQERGGSRQGLQGHESLDLSVTPQSVTFLIDVDEQKLVHHSAEVDYLDPDRPLILVFPASPLKHQTHYALAVIGALDENGRKLPRTKGMTTMLKETKSETRFRLIHRILPAMQKAIPWYSYQDDPESLQLVFDFVTISEKSQLGPIRTVRDIAKSYIERSDWNWKNHVNILEIREEDCDHADSNIARTVHLDLDVPWFLSHDSRYAFLDNYKLNLDAQVTLGRARAMIQIPCSVKAAVTEDAGKKLRAILEYGHGLFFFREEVSDRFLQKMANENGYINMSMDWRGMSIFDLPVVLKTLISSPYQFQSIRDNLIQGFANKMCLQHFSQNGMLELDAFHFDGKPIPIFEEKQPASAFYGISQGGILGGGYMSYIGSTGYVQRGVLGVPGTPFALVMSRSLDFSGYDMILLLNFYNNRHVRILLSLVQMAWDSTEASGHQAPPVREPIPRLLLQAGLGDPVVPTLAAEALARSLNASTLPNSPRLIYGVTAGDAASAESSGVDVDNSTYLGPHVTLSELLYEKEYNSLPLDDHFAESNKVHICVRLDPSFIAQIVEFVNTGRVINPCEADQCRRISAQC